MLNALHQQEMALITSHCGSMQGMQGLGAVPGSPTSGMRWQRAFNMVQVREKVAAFLPSWLEQCLCVWCCRLARSSGQARSRHRRRRPRR